MVRIWNVHPKHLDDERLLGEHRELHAIVGAITKYYKGEKAGWQRHPEAKKFYKKLGYLKQRHAMLVREFRARGWQSGRLHETPLDFRGVPRWALSSKFRITRAMLRKDAADLRRRWRREGKSGGRIALPGNL
ncbi:MAG: pyrimidine dimer DNA glycosylase/endonuclease V [Candidatus Aenigmatarchaeota archaeon]